jgi:hypothetical protein
MYADRINSIFTGLDVRQIWIREHQPSALDRSFRAEGDALPAPLFPY